MLPSLETTDLNSENLRQSQRIRTIYERKAKQWKKSLSTLSV